MQTKCVINRRANGSQQKMAMRLYGGATSATRCSYPLSSSRLFPFGFGDGEVDEFLAAEEAFPEVVALAFGDDQGDELFLARGFVPFEESGGVVFEGNDSVFVAMNEESGDLGFCQLVDVFDGVEFLEA